LACCRLRRARLCRIGCFALSAAQAFDPSKVQEPFVIMPPFKQPTFQERAALAAKARQAALDNLRARPPVDEAALAERRAAQLARQEAQALARKEKQAAREQEKADKKARAAEAAAPAMSEAEMKAARDARYAARKNRAGKR
jgi:hypothetical protein